MFHDKCFTQWAREDTEIKKNILADLELIGVLEI
jgi:hypothetical protein